MCVDEFAFIVKSDYFIAAPSTHVSAQLVGGGAVERKRIYGVLGVLRLVAGPYLLVVTERREVGVITGHTIWEVRRMTFERREGIVVSLQMVKAEIIPFTRTQLHLTEREAATNMYFVQMVHL